VWVEMMRRGVGRFHALIIAMLLSRLTLGEVQRKKREKEKEERKKSENEERKRERGEKEERE
jgi:hypothetical protein